MPGQWLPPEKKRKHRCALPNLYSSSKAKVGNRWRCGCGKTYVVVSESQHGESWLDFRRVKED